MRQLNHRGTGTLPAIQPGIPAPASYASASGGVIEQALESWICKSKKPHVLKIDQKDFLSSI